MKSSNLYNFIVIDHYDSFTSNLIELLKPFSNSLRSFYSKHNYDAILSEIRNTTNVIVVLSPGYGSAHEHKNSIKLVKEIQSTIPIIGVCLGHQIIAIANEGKVEKGQAVHGKTSQLVSNHEIFNKFKQQRVGRYHSYHVSSEVKNFSIIAENETKEIMAIESNSRICYGLQFHVESILTTYGSDIIKNILRRIEENHEFTKAS